MIVVFGAGGFIGTYTVRRLLDEGQEVLACDVSPVAEAYYRHERIPYLHLDITREEDFERLPADIDAVVHLACVQPANVSKNAYDPSDYVRVNVLGTLNILKACHRRRVPKLVYTCSHRNTQGMWAEKNGTPIRESDGRSIKFTGEYAMFSISESAATDCVLHYAASTGLEAFVLRLPPVYGYGPHTEIFLDGKPIRTGYQIFIDRAERGEPIDVWGDPNAGRDIVYVKDVASAIVAALQSPSGGGLYNISSGRRLSLEEQARTIIDVFSTPERRSEIRYLPDKPNNIETYVYDIGEARRALGWKPEYSFREMLTDYQREMESGRFAFLVEKRRQQLAAAEPSAIA